MKKFEIYQYKAIVLLVCCAVLVGAGACSVIKTASNQRYKAITKKQTEKSIQLFKEIKARVDDNQATATDYYLLAQMVYYRSFRSKIGMAELNKNKSDKIYANYLQQAIKKGSQEAKLDYANFLFEQNKNLDNKEKYLKLKQSLNLIEEVLNRQCEVYKKPHYPKFYAYPKKKVKINRHWLNWNWYYYKKIKSDYPKLYQLAQKTEQTYKKNCEKEK